MDNTEQILNAMQQKIDDLTSILMHTQHGPTTGPFEVATPEHVEAIQASIDAEEERKGYEAMEIIMDFLSRQFLPRPVQLAYDHISKSMGCDADA